MEEKTAISMVITNGVWLVGRLIGGNKLLKPRIFQIIDKGERIQMSPLPGTPPFARIPVDALVYTVPEREKNLIDLYEQVTDPKVDPIDPRLN